MMRETKVGLVVAGTFLSFAGGVFGLRMYQHQNAPSEGGSEVAAVEPPTPVTPVNAAPPAPVPINSPATVAIPTAIPAATPTTQTPVNANPVALPNPATLVPAPEVVANTLPVPQAPLVAPTAVPAPPANANVIDTPKPADNAATPTTPHVDTPKPATPMVVDAAVTPPPAASPPSVPDQPKTAESPPWQKVEAAPAPAPDASKPPENPAPVNNVPAAVPPAVPVVPTPDNNNVQPPVVVVPSDLNLGGNPAVAPNTGPAPAPAEQPKTAEPVKTAEPTPPNATLTSVPSTAPGKLDAPVRAEGGTPRPLPDAVFPAGGTPVVVPAPKPPANDSFLEEEYRTQNGDNFTAISRRSYNSERYANALQQYNRDYPLASANLRSDPPRLGNGQVVWIPPIRILERRYPHLVPGLAPATKSEANPNWNSATTTAAPSYKTYRVKGANGETMAEIARQTLGNPSRWNEIYRLNPSANPSFTVPIPMGSLLKLPADAKVE